ncbi:serine hydrolase domain-containing protein [Paenibacillus sp. 481]|uniref:serine hydrolase domain-containing protein n=1 Tax=Paenibacillus sp. 481 TaxID=2835869 RepID=UPI001E50E6C2|nr:serine hydrolase domain-containing protein [Paenibacillus sp. 481]UHA72137.1 beta-lactamase family protein [Paenibacillus sp. 481]
MFLTKEISDQFNPVIEHVERTQRAIQCSGAAIMVIHRDKVVAETYWGQHSPTSDARAIQADSQFHVASVRKSYIGFAVAYAIHHGYISSIDAPVSDYIPSLHALVIKGTTIRHLLTHTHGLNIENGEMVREFPPGESWSYRGVGVDLLCDIVYTTTGKSVSQILAEEVFEPLEFKETGWYAVPQENFVDTVRDPNNPHWGTFESTNGDKMNMYVSARELGRWGYFHLQGGNVLGGQVVSPKIIEMATSFQSPVLNDIDLPQNGFLWFVKEHSAKRHEIGEMIPAESYQILGYSGVTLLVIPKYETVVVRMFNGWGSPSGFDYLANVREFGDGVMRCLK